MLTRPLTKKEQAALKNTNVKVPQTDNVSDAEFQKALEENGCESCYDAMTNFCTMVSYVITCCGCCTSWDDWTDG